MSNQIQPFDFNGIQVRVLTDEHGNPWFLGADVCAILGTATNHIREYLDADEITNIRSTDIAQNGGNAAEEFPFGSMLYGFSSTNGDHVNIRVCRRCKMNPCRCTMAGEKLLRTVKRKPVPYCSETMLENLRKQDTHQLH